MLRNLWGQTFVLVLLKSMKSARSNTEKPNMYTLCSF